MRFLQSLKKKALQSLLPFPVEARHAEYSLLISADDESAPPTPELVALGAKAIQNAQSIDLTAVCERMKEPPYTPNIWPGELYKLLAGLVQEVKPSLVVEIGTGIGASALSMLPFMPAHGRIVTFDIVAWKDFELNMLRDEDFAGGNLIQHVEDRTQDDIVEKHRDLLESAPLIYMDAAKDGNMEAILLEKFKTLNFKTKNPLIFFDDIKVWNMLKAWRELPYPKLDLTSFGHWTGTGLVAWQ